MKDPATGRKALNGEWSKMFPDAESRPARHTLALGAQQPQPRHLRLHGGDRRLMIVGLRPPGPLDGACPLPQGEAAGAGVSRRVTPRPTSPSSGRGHDYERALEARGPARLPPRQPQVGDRRADEDLRLRVAASRPCAARGVSTHERVAAASSRQVDGAVELLQQALVVVGVLVVGAAAEARAVGRGGGRG